MSLYSNPIQLNPIELSVNRSLRKLFRSSFKDASRSFREPFWRFIKGFGCWLCLGYIQMILLLVFTMVSNRLVLQNCDHIIFIRLNREIQIREKKEKKKGKTNQTLLYPFDDSYLFYVTFENKDEYVSLVLSNSKIKHLMII